MIRIPPYVNDLLTALREKGYSAYPVGGCVRDSLMGLAPADWDICTDARPADVERVFSDRRVIETGLRHGTVTVMQGDRPVEVTTFRAESGYADGRRPDSVRFIGSLTDDLARRDFTINAMAVGENGVVIDPYGGQEDLRAGVIRCVGEPGERFHEDALRILRALRFAARLGFVVEPATAAAVNDLAAALDRISRERVFSELKGILVGAHAGDVLRAFPEVIFRVVPELAPERGFLQHNPHHTHDVWTHTTMAVDAVERDAVLRLAMLLHDVGKPETFFLDEKGVGHFYGHAELGARTADAALRRLRCDNASRDEIVRLVACHAAPPPQTKKGVRRLLIQLGEALFRRLILCWRADAADRSESVRARHLAAIARTEKLLCELIAAESCFSLRELAVNGGDLLSLGMRPGPAVGEMLRTLFDAVTEDGVPNERELLLSLAKKRLRF